MTKENLSSEESQTLASKSPPRSLKQNVQKEALALVPEMMARRYNVVPIAVSHKTLQIAMVDTTDIFALEALSAKTQMRIKSIAASAEEIRDAIDFSYKGYGDIDKELARISTSAEESNYKLASDTDIDAPIVRILSLIIEDGVRARASDVHLEPTTDRLRIRYRIDGVLHEVMILPLTTHRPLISRIKILANMDIADHLRPQDGQLSYNAKGREVDIRVATIPALSGEMAVLRLLDKSLGRRRLSDLGFLPDSLAKYESVLKIPYGIILVSGPTGSGKTTTLYASVNSLNTAEANVITIEDPPEFRFEAINQIEVNPQAGITFATGLRSVLRLDPDVILVGEIRDSETANIAIQAALTGHLMLSSVHANDATSVLFRLIDLGIERFLVAASVIAIVAQRMVRRVCPDCGRLIEAPLVESLAYEREMGEKKSEFIYGIGCETCSYTGYFGRTGIFEVLVVSDTIRKMLVDGASNVDIRAEALREGMIPMMKDGLTKVKAGITTPSEVLRTAYTSE